MEYINYAKEMKRVVLPRYQEPKPSGKSTGFVRPLGDSKVKVTSKEEKKEEVNEAEQMGL